nr:copia protein [Tanacetum cinerariifolium]
MIVKTLGSLVQKVILVFFIGYSADSCAYRIYNRRTKKIMETMNVSFDELLAMDFKQRSSKPGLQSELDLLFEAMYDDYIGGQPLATARTYQAKPTEKHLKEVKRIFRYLEGTVNTGLWYTKDYGFELTGFSDVDYAGCKDTFKSTSEYVSLSACCAQVLWMRTQLTNYGFHFNKIPVYCDSKSAIAISCNPVHHSRTKHITVCYHFIKEHVEKGTIELYFVKTDYQLADLFTKALPADRFNYLGELFGISRKLNVSQMISQDTLIDFIKQFYGSACQSRRDLPRNTPLDRVEVLDFYWLSHFEIVDIEKVAVRSSLRVPNNKCAFIESRANEIHQKSH